jgi:CBS domain-containing protein
VKVSALLSGQPVTIEPSILIDEAYGVMRDWGIRHLPVVQDGRLVGMISDRDVLLIQGQPSQQNDTCDSSGGCLVQAGVLVEEIMSYPVRCVQTDADLAAAINMMLDDHISAVAVQDGENLRGIITTTDILGWYLDFCMVNPDHPAGNAYIHTRMHKEGLVTADPEQRIERVLGRMVSARVRHLPVADRKRLVGIISDRDLRRKLGITVAVPDGQIPELRPEFQETTVGQIMTPDPQTARPGDRLGEAVQRMVTERLGALPVVRDDGNLVGLLTATDIIRAARSLLSETSDSRTWR